MPLFRYFLLALIISIPSQADSGPCIGVVMAGGGLGFWQDVEKGAYQAAKELGIEVYVRGAVNEQNVKAQRSLIGAVKKRGCGALVLAPNSPERKKDVQSLRQSGIPTVYIDRDMGGEAVSIIKTDNFLAGKLAAQKMIEALNGHGKVVVLRQGSNVASTKAREEGFIQSAKSGGLEILFETYIGSTVGEARIGAQKVLAQIDEIDGIFTPNESTTIGTVASLKTLKIAGKAIHIGFDSSKLIVDAINSRQLYGVVVQQPVVIGYKGVHMAYRAMHGKPVESTVNTEVVFVTKQNLEQWQADAK